MYVQFTTPGASVGPVIPGLGRARGLRDYVQFNTPRATVGARIPGLGRYRGMGGILDTIINAAPKIAQSVASTAQAIKGGPSSANSESNNKGGQQNTQGESQNNKPGLDPTTSKVLTYGSIGVGGLALLSILRR